MPREPSAELRCEVQAASGDPGSRVLELMCDGEAARLFVEADPAPAGDGFAAGQVLKIRSIVAPGEAANDPDVWLRVEDAGGALLLAAVVGARVDPPEGGGWAAPFAWREAAGTCMVEETACGETRRAALDLQPRAARRSACTMGHLRRPGTKGRLWPTSRRPGRTCRGPDVPGSSCSDSSRRADVAARKRLGGSEPVW
ncbi:hypothetical protein [Nannocystis pusilla]|uniref:hypothetical protein n=1 Tax=Nannocystis pusilla TaxID=889268 RepID=UPI003B79296C